LCLRDGTLHGLFRLCEDANEYRYYSLTCRKRRVKCDEGKPTCATCIKSGRECIYATDATALPGTDRRRPSLHASLTPSAQDDEPRMGHSPNSISNGTRKLFIESPERPFDSPPTNAPSIPSPNSAPLEWYDLLAEDAINNIDRYNSNLEMDRDTLARRQSRGSETAYRESRIQSPQQGPGPMPLVCEQWNSPNNILMTSDELVLFQHYIEVIAPMIDVCDPSRQFTTTVPGLAVHNVGLLKSILAVAARHLALKESQMQHTESSVQIAVHGAGNQHINISSPLRAATQYYYETLHYLSRNLLYPSYSKSREIIATALLISTYEMFDVGHLASNGAWERHLRGIFWIQRAQNNNGECQDPLRRAAWWQWLRQDTWAAFREGRRVLTIWRPTKRLMDLTSDELCLRIIYISGRCVDFAANESKYDITTRIAQGDKLVHALHDWYNAIPASFQPIYKVDSPRRGHIFTPIWVHPPSYASAILHFHFARTIVIINQPPIGGIGPSSERQRLLDQSVDTICGMTMMHQLKGMPLMTTDFQALYAAGLCTQNPDKKMRILRLLEKTVEMCNFPPRSMLDTLVSHW